MLFIFFNFLLFYFLLSAWDLFKNDVFTKEDIHDHNLKFIAKKIYDDSVYELMVSSSSSPLIYHGIFIIILLQLPTQHTLFNSYLLYYSNVQ